MIDEDEDRGARDDDAKIAEDGGDKSAKGGDAPSHRDGDESGDAPSNHDDDDVGDALTDREDDDDDFPSLDEMIGTFFSEASLLPIVVVVLGSGGAFGAALLVMTAVDRNPFAMGALVLLTGMTVDISLRARKEADMRNLALLIGLVWASSVALAILAAWTGLAFG